MTKQEFFTLCDAAPESSELRVGIRDPIWLRGYVVLCCDGASGERRYETLFDPPIMRSGIGDRYIEITSEEGRQANLDDAAESFGEWLNEWKKARVAQ